MTCSTAVRSKAKENIQTRVTTLEGAVQAISQQLATVIRLQEQAAKQGTGGEESLVYGDIEHFSKATYKIN